MKYDAKPFGPISGRSKQNLNEFTPLGCAKEERDPNALVFTPTQPTISRTQGERYEYLDRLSSCNKFIKR